MTTSAWQPRTDVDRGEADAGVREALAAAYSGGDAYARAIAALCTARLILPTVPAPADAEPGISKRDGHDDHDHASAGETGETGDAPAHDHPDMAVVHLRSAGGDKGVVVFTGYDALHAWRADAHPVRCTLDDVAATVRETESSTILVDIAGPHPLVIEEDLIAELARGHRLVVLPDGGFGWMWLDEGARDS